jgi:hypothetical protein
MPNPKVVDHSVDSGQRGWRIHAVDIEDDKTTLGEIRLATAACGLVPGHGWSVDLFIGRGGYDQRCKRCVRALAKHGIHPHPFQRLTEKDGRYIPLAERTKR